MAKQKAQQETTGQSPSVQTAEQLQTPVPQRRPGPSQGIQRWAASAPNDGSGVGASARARNSRSLQRQAGNTHLSLPSGGVVQPKLAPHQPEDSHEQEADRVAGKVMRMQQPNGSNGLRSGLATKSALGNGGGGYPLPPATRTQMESSLGADLSNVNIHTDEQAARASQELNAEAFTHGQDIYFGEGRYQPHTSQGQQLLAHELTHTIQQGSTTAEPARQTDPTVSRPDDPLEREADAVADQIATGAQATAPTISAAAPEARTKLSRQENETVPAQAEAAPSLPAEPVSLAGAGPFPPPAVAAYVDTLGSADIPVQLGSIAQGTIPIEKHRNSYRTPGRGRAAYRPIPLMQPTLQPLRDAGVNPVLAVRIQDGILDGYVTIATEEGAAGNPAALINWIKEHATEMGWLGMDISRIPDPVNEMSDGVLRLQLNNFPFRLGGFMQGTGSFGFANEAVNFSATATISVQNLSEAQLEISRDEEGHLAGRAEVPVEIANFSGNLIAEYGNGTVNIQGTIGYNADKFSGEVTLLVTDRQTARNVARQQLGPEAIAASAQEAAGASEGSEGPIPGPRALAGYGTLNFAFTEWMTGSALVIIDNEGHITVVGEIAPPAEVELFPQRDYIYELFSTEIRTLYGVPLVGNVFLFANIGIDALAKLGPGKIYNIAVRGRYSTDPEVLQNYELEATLNISAFAGLRLRAEGGVGVELAGHDIKAGVGVMGLAGVRGYVEATPTIGYRETADPEEGRQGEYFINGHMEIAAQPFLGLSGDLFVELDSPWWSPAPDDKWTWPLGELEYPLPGEFGIGADVDYVIGSNELPEIQFGEVDFSADRFMTDLVNDHVPPKRGGEQEQPGEWQEGETTGETAEPAVNETEAPPAVQEPAQGQQRPDQGEPPAPNVQQQWLDGMQALGSLAERSRDNPFTQAEIESALTEIRRQHGFTTLRATQVGEDWRVHAAMNPEGDVTVEGEITEGGETSVDANQMSATPATNIPALTPGETIQIYVSAHRMGWKAGDFEGYEEYQGTRLLKVRVGNERFLKPVTDYNQDHGWKLYTGGQFRVNYGSLDGLGRPTGIEATLGLPLPQGSEASQSIRPPGFVGGEVGHARGHLLARQLGGSGRDRRNLVTLLQTPVNTPVMSGYEGQALQAVEEGQIVQYRVEPVYRGSDPMPIGITMIASGDGGFSINVTILNRA